MDPIVVVPLGGGHHLVTAEVNDQVLQGVYFHGESDRPLPQFIMAPIWNEQVRGGSITYWDRHGTHHVLAVQVVSQLHP